MRDLRMLVLGVLALLAVGATTAAGASAKQVGLFEPQTGTQVANSQKLGTVVNVVLEGGRAQCRTAPAGDLEPWLPFEAPPLRTTIFYSDGARQSGECSSDVAGETIELGGGGLLEIELAGLAKATVTAPVKVHEYQPGGLYCTYAAPYRSHLGSVAGADRAEWTGTVVLKRAHIESDAECAETVSSELTIGVSGAEAWDGEALETRRVS